MSRKLCCVSNVPYSVISERSGQRRDSAREGIRPEKGSDPHHHRVQRFAFLIIYLWIFHTRARTTRTLFSKDKKQSNENASKASKQYLIIKFYMWDPGPACKRSDRTQVKKSYRIHINDPTGSYNYTKFR